jgi:amino-acid N-acetyltransferase
VGFAAVEIYSRKLGEIQSLAVADGYQGNGIGSALVKACVDRAREKGILEVMAISASEEFLRKLGFDYSLPDQKRALFCQLHSREEIFRDDGIED